MKTDIYITNFWEKIYFRDWQIIVEDLAREKRFFPIETISSIIVLKPVYISAKVYKEVFKRNIPIYFVWPKGDYLWKIESLQSSHISLKYKQYKYFFDDNFKLEFSKKIVYSKIENQIRFLKRYKKNYNLQCGIYLEKLKELQHKVLKVVSLEQLRWYEGNAAKMYFLCYWKLFKWEFYFIGRNKRPPKDPINSLLSFWYTLLAQSIYTSLALLWLDVYCWYYHSPKDNRPILVLDMMENWRTLVVDSLIVKLYKRWSIKKDNFIFVWDNGFKVLIKPSFRDFFIQEYQKRILTKISYPGIERKITIKEAFRYQWLDFIKYLNRLTNFKPYIFNW